MNLLCSLFGHQPPIYAPKGWYSPGEKYAKVKPYATDGIGREHASIISECPRCREEFELCMIHLPETESEKKALAALAAVQKGGE